MRQGRIACIRLALVPRPRLPLSACTVARVFSTVPFGVRHFSHGHLYCTAMDGVSTTAASAEPHTDDSPATPVAAAGSSDDGPAGAGSSAVDKPAVPAATAAATVPIPDFDAIFTSQVSVVALSIPGTCFGATADAGMPLFCPSFPVSLVSYPPRAARSCGEMTKLLRPFMFRASRTQKAVCVDPSDAERRLLLLSPYTTTSVDLEGIPDTVRAQVLAHVDKVKGR